ncbi:sensor histidine kinase [Nocardioides sp. CPCC 205120]|uniref:sensor histidine kinase n=1 Tax=Nocardioides sp. CPCC 205120 TaxID=3406462 RepID=UPI003B5090D3
MTPRPRRETPALADQRLLRRASVVIALQTGVAAAAVIAVVIGLVYTVSLQARLDATERKVRDKVENAEAFGHAGEDLIADGLLDGCTQEDARAATDDLPAGVQEVQVCDAPFLAYVAETDGSRVVAVTSFVEQQEETERLAWLSMLAGLLGALAAGGLGWVVARRAVRPLGDALTSQRRFVADASHELRTPLAILLTRAQLLARGPTTDPDQREELGQLVDDARTMSGVVDDMLLSAELQHRRPPPETVDLVTVVEDVRRSFAATANEHHVDLVVDVPAGASYPVTGMAGALRRAVAALVDNALAHVEEGGTVVITLDRSDSTVTVAVVDDGSGLDPDLAAELTQRFRRGAEPRSATEGTSHRLGLGLALVDEIVTAHGGSLAITGSPGEGATVSFTLPAAPRPL